MANMITSKTSQTVAGAGVVGGGTAFAIITWLRSMWPDMPGDIITDTALGAVITGVIVPLLGRLVARYRGKL